MWSGGAKLNFAGVPGSTFTMQGSPTLADPWTNVAIIRVGDSGAGTLRITNPRQGVGFYRTLR
jgi:hypothetical protein